MCFSVSEGKKNTFDALGQCSEPPRSSNAVAGNKKLNRSHIFFCRSDNTCTYDSDGHRAEKENEQGKERCARSRLCVFTFTEQHSTCGCRVSKLALYPTAFRLFENRFRRVETD